MNHTEVLLPPCCYGLNFHVPKVARKAVADYVHGGDGGGGDNGNGGVGLELDGGCLLPVQLQPGQYH